MFPFKNIYTATLSHIKNGFIQSKSIVISDEILIIKCNYTVKSDKFSKISKNLKMDS